MERVERKGEDLFGLCVFVGHTQLKQAEVQSVNFSVPYTLVCGTIDFLRGVEGVCCFSYDCCRICLAFSTVRRRGLHLVHYGGVAVVDWGPA